MVEIIEDRERGWEKDARICCPRWRWWEGEGKKAPDFRINAPPNSPPPKAAPRKTAGSEKYSPSKAAKIWGVSGRNSMVRHYLLLSMKPPDFAAGQNIFTKIKHGMTANEVEKHCRCRHHSADKLPQYSFSTTLELGHRPVMLHYVKAVFLSTQAFGWVEAKASHLHHPLCVISSIFFSQNDTK